VAVTPCPLPSVFEGIEHWGLALVFSRIVVGTDGSETASEAVALAVQIARQNSARLHLVVGVHSSAAVAVPSGGASFSDPAGGPVLRKAAASVLEAMAEAVHTDVGNPADVIVRVADEVGADLIVVGSKGMQGKRRILGSVPNRVAHKAGCHVLVAKTT
jgi:nucleotide-binding universal stress UspA family protein